METKPVKKVNIIYLLLVILIPAVVLAVGAWISVLVDKPGEGGAATLFLALALWFVAPILIWNREKTKMMQQLRAQGFALNQTFYSSSQTVSVDMRQGKVAMLFYWNPFTLYVVSAGRITKAWTDDGLHRSLFMRVTNRVSFLFMVDKVKVRVNTFTSNKNPSEHDDDVIEGIAKADMWVNVLKEAHDRALAVNGPN